MRQAGKAPMSLDEALKVMGFSTMPTFDELRRAYLSAAVRWHPDRRMDDDRNVRKGAQKVKQIRAAYEQLAPHAKQMEETHVTKSEEPPKPAGAAKTHQSRKKAEKAPRQTRKPKKRPVCFHLDPIRIVGSFGGWMLFAFVACLPPVLLFWGWGSFWTFVVWNLLPSTLVGVFCIRAINTRVAKFNEAEKLLWSYSSLSDPGAGPHGCKELLEKRSRLKSWFLIIAFAVAMLFVCLALFFCLAGLLTVVGWALAYLFEIESKVFHVSACIARLSLGPLEVAYAVFTVLDVGTFSRLGGEDSEDQPRDNARRTQENG